MPFESSCCCPRHDEWKHGEVSSHQLRQCTRDESRWLEESLGKKQKHGRKRKICVSCRSRLEMEVKYQKLEVSAGNKQPIIFTPTCRELCSYEECRIPSFFPKSLPIAF